MILNILYGIRAAGASRRQRHFLFWMALAVALVSILELFEIQSGDVNAIDEPAHSSMVVDREDFAHRSSARLLAPSRELRFDSAVTPCQALGPAAPCPILGVDCAV